MPPLAQIAIRQAPQLAAALRGSALLVGPDEYEPKRGAKGFANLVNGDCMPHALGLGVQYLLGRKVCKDPEHVALGQRVRALLHAHIDEHWRAAPSCVRDPILPPGRPADRDSI